MCVTDTVFVCVVCVGKNVWAVLITLLSQNMCVVPVEIGGGFSFHYNFLFPHQQFVELVSRQFK